MVRQASKRLRSRQNARYNVYITVSLLQDDCTEERTLGEGDAFDLSAKGCQIFTEQGLEQGAYLGLRLSLPGQEEPVRVGVAAVRWVREQKCGLEFISMTSTDRKRLEQFVAYLNSVAK